MQLQQLNSQHPSVKLNLFNRYRCLYSGGDLFYENIKKFLTKNVNEDPEVYTRRCAEASYRSYSGPIIDHYGSQVFSAPYCIRPTINNKLVDDIDEFYPEFKEDCDLKGTDLSSFMKHQLITALILGKAYWLIDLPEKSEEVKSLADYKDNGLDKARLVDIEPESVLDFELDDYGEFTYIVLHYKEYRRPTIKDSRNICTETWKIYTVNTVEIYQIQYDPKKTQLKPTDDIPLLDSYDHGFFKVPIICLDLPMGLWLMDRIAAAQLEHFRLSAALSWSLKKGAYAVPVFNLKDPEEPPKNGPGFGMILGQEDKLSFAEPIGSSYGIMQKEIAEQKNEIYRVSQQIAQSADNSAGSLGRSGESKVMDQQATEICCKSFGTLVREAIEKTFELISDARGDIDIKFSVEGLDQYSFADPATIIANAKLAKDAGMIGSIKASNTFTKEVMKTVVNSMINPDTKQEIKDLISKEIDEAEIEEPPQPDQLMGGKPPFNKDQKNGEVKEKSKAPSNLE